MTNAGFIGHFEREHQDSNEWAEQGKNPVEAFDGWWCWC